jgi:signal transduction histidine kinase
VPSSTLTERLTALPTLAEIPEEQLGWLATHGELRRFADGTVLYGKGESEFLRSVFVVLSGRFSVRVDRDGVERKVREVTAGQISGLLPYSRITNPAGYMVADGPVEILAIAEADIRAMTRACYDFTALCVHAMLDRVRTFKGDDLHREKMAALGRLSAGLAHELNNPSSAMVRTAAELDTCRREVAVAARALGAARLTEAGQAAVDTLEDAAAREPAEPYSTLALGDREDRLVEWLERHGLDPAAAYGLAGTGLAIADLDTAAEELDGDALAVAVRYVAAEAAARQLTSDIGTAATRVHTLVTAVKAHTHMDRGAAPEAMALGQHLADAITLLASKASAKKISIELDVEPDLPPVHGVVTELNHVWLNLIDNAIDAAPTAGRVTVSAGTDRGHVVVAVVDDGPGIDAEVLSRVFDPFFTTKDVGRGTGLGLDVVRAIVRNHGGSVDTTSRPGRTEFRVVLPVTAVGGS